MIKPKREDVVLMKSLNFNSTGYKYFLVSKKDGSFVAGYWGSPQDVANWIGPEVPLTNPQSVPQSVQTKIVNKSVNSDPLRPTIPYGNKTNTRRLIEAIEVQSTWFTGRRHDLLAARLSALKIGAR